SWSHHYVWVVPALAWLALSPSRPAAGRAWAAGTAILFWAAPIWWVPDPQSGYGAAATLAEGNAFFLAAAAFPVLLGLMLWLRRDTPAAPAAVSSPPRPGQNRASAAPQT